MLTSVLALSMVATGLSGCFGGKEDEADKPSRDAQKSAVPAETQQKSDNKKPDEKYKDGQYQSDVIETKHGNLQLELTIKDGRIDEIKALSIPDADETGKRVNSKAVPEYIKEALAAQDDDIDVVSGATYTHKTFKKALDNALDKAEVE